MALIVVLDDRVTNRNIFSKLASTIEAGVSVRAFGDPVEALDWLRENTPDLIITDYKMPHMDGAEFIRRFREIPRGADIPIVVITVYEERGFRLRALEAQQLEELRVVVLRHAPLGVVIGDIERIRAAPGAARLVVGMPQYRRPGRAHKPIRSNRR